MTLMLGCYSLMEKNVVDVEAWPGEGGALGGHTGDGHSSITGQFYFVSGVAAAVGNALEGGREHHKCDENVNNQGKRERKCEVAL